MLKVEAESALALTGGCWVVKKEKIYDGRSFIGDGGAASGSAHARHCATTRRDAPWRTRSAVSCVTKAHSPSNATLKTFSRARRRNGESENDIKLSRGGRSSNSTSKFARSALDTRNTVDYGFWLFLFSSSSFLWSWLWRKVTRCDFRRSNIYWCGRYKVLC